MLNWILIDRFLTKVRDVMKIIDNIETIESEDQQFLAIHDTMYHQMECNVDVKTVHHPRVIDEIQSVDYKKEIQNKDKKALHMKNSILIMKASQYYE